MPDEMTPSMPPQPASEAPVAPVEPTASTEPAVPQNIDKSDAMTYPLGSQNTQPASEAIIEDHRSILDRIMGIFSKGKKETPVETQMPQMPSSPETPTPVQ